MSYNELVQAYFERSVALQWYWTVYILVIGSVLGFTTLRQHPETVTVVFVTILYGCFAYKNLTSIELTMAERHAFRVGLMGYPASGPNEQVMKKVQEQLDPRLTESDSEGVRSFHVVCDLLTLAALWGKEWLRRKRELSSPAAVR